MLDRVFAAISMLGVIAFVGVVMWFVREPDLIIVCVLVIGIAIIFIWQDLKSAGNQVENEPRGDKSDT